MNFEASRKWRRFLELFLISFLTLYFELIIIRWVSSEVRVFAYLKNLPLIASFLGMGLGCACARSRTNYSRHFPMITAVLCAVIACSGKLGITFLPFPSADYLIVGDVTGGFDFSTLSNKLLALSKFLATVLAVFSLCVAMFLALGQKLGRLLNEFPPLIAYSINITGSLLGVLVFSAISFAGWSPLVWFAIGFALLIGLLPNWKSSVVAFAATLLIIRIAPSQASWSPYYRIDLSPIRATGAGANSPIVGHNLGVNHDYFQRMLDLSKDAVSTEFTERGRAYYNLIYQFVRPERVLVVGAGSGNDVAAALRNGAKRVDAVEIDPLIIRLGKQLHPEQPYQSTRVRIFNNDARAFLKQSQEQYDLIVFGLLDSQTLLSSMSSIRLDNYIYTLESLREAKAHLTSSGTISLSFALVETWIQERFYRMLQEVFGTEPLVLKTPYDSGISYLVGPTSNLQYVTQFPELRRLVINDAIPSTGTPLPTDDWPFLYLRERAIPFVYVFTLTILLLFSFYWVKRLLASAKTVDCQSSQDVGNVKAMNVLMFLLGAGFMLMEVKSISDLSLLFGSTWLVNSVVIASILTMILLANAIVIRWQPSSMTWVYCGLAGSLTLGYFFKPAVLAALPFFLKAVTGGFICSIPIFFAGILFASCFRRVTDVPSAFGANLMGALVGGILENLSMIFGIAFLNLLALGIYFLSYVSLHKQEWLFWRGWRVNRAADA